jgi:chitin synthase
MSLIICLPEYEAEAWETGTRHSDETGYESKAHSRSQAQHSQGSPHTYNQASQSGDYYRDTNIMHNNSSNPNLRLGGSQLSHSNISHHGAVQPQLPFMPFGGGPGSVAGSDYGHGMGMQMMPQLGYQNTGSMFGMMPPNVGMMSNMNMFSGGSNHGSQYGTIPPSIPALGGGQRPMSTFSLATTVNPFAGPSMNPNPSDDELFNALRGYLSTQDLMTVTKK